MLCKKAESSENYRHFGTRCRRLTRGGNHTDEFKMLISYILTATFQCGLYQLVQEMERSADVLSAGLLQVADPSLSSRFFLKQVCNIFCMKYTGTSHQFHESRYLCFIMGLIYDKLFSVDNSIGWRSKIIQKILSSTSPYGNLTCPEIRKKKELEKRNMELCIKLMEPE